VIVKPCVIYQGQELMPRNVGLVRLALRLYFEMKVLGFRVIM